jgi:hypothetical protein
MRIDTNSHGGLGQDVPFILFFFYKAIKMIEKI